MFTKHKLYIGILLFALQGCISDTIDSGTVPENGTRAICPSVEGLWTEGGVATKSLVNSQTSADLEVNFLRIDEEAAMNYEFDSGDDTYSGITNWEEAYILEGDLMASADRDFRRSAYLNPTQAYQVSTDGSGNDLFHHTRMISWHPRTCVIRKNDGKAAITKFNYYKNAAGAGKIYEASKGEVKLKFEDLDGQTDVMVSEVIEAQQYHRDNGMKTLPCGSSLNPGPHREPFGYSASSPSYDNTFTYKHYLSAVKIFGYSEANSQQVISMWGHINKIIVVDQPSECYVAIPKDIEKESGRSAHTPEAEFVGSHDFPIVKTAIFGNDSNSDDPQDNLIGPDNPTLEGHTATNKLYLGYALIAPGRTLKLDIHTDSGIYRVEVDGKNFKASKIHTLHLKFGTTATIAAIILDDATGKYYDLTTGNEYEAGGIQLQNYKYANCYILHNKLRCDRDGDGRTDGENDWYDGFCFSATKIGNAGIYPGYYRTDVDIKPVKAALLWEEIEGSIEDVDLLYGYVRFRTPNYGKNPKPCNAVVGVYGEKNTLLWSWHIWMTMAEPKDYEYDLGNGVTVTVMDRNLGSVYSYPDKKWADGVPAEEAVLKSYGLYYQWGRKDPSMYPPQSDFRPKCTETSEWFDEFANKMTSWQVMELPTPSMTDATENPMSLIMPTEVAAGYKFDWLFDSKSDLWGYGPNSLKTINDPCPYGYKVPTVQLEYLMSAAQGDVQELSSGAYQKVGSGNEITVSTLKSTELGRRVGLYINQGENNIFLPFAGYKGVDRGMSSQTCAWKYVGTKGDYMSALAPENAHRNRLYISDALFWQEAGTDGKARYEYSAVRNFITDETNRRTAGSVRCVKDTPIGSIIIDLSCDNGAYSVGDRFDINFNASAYGADLTPLDYTLILLHDYMLSDGTIINEKESDTYIKYHDGDAYSSSGTYDMTGKNSFNFQIGDYPSQPNFLKIQVQVWVKGIMRESRKLILTIGTGWDPNTLYEAEGNNGEGTIKTTKSLDESHAFIFNLKNSQGTFLRPQDDKNGNPDFNVPINASQQPENINENVFLSKSHIHLENFKKEAAHPTIANYKNVGSAYLAYYYNGGSGSEGTTYYLKRTEDAWSGSGTGTGTSTTSGVVFTTNKSEATRFYICSDWNNSAQDYVDIIDQAGNYLYYETAYKRLKADTSFRNRPYQWYIHAGK